MVNLDNINATVINFTQFEAYLTKKNTEFTAVLLTLENKHYVATITLG